MGTIKFDEKGITSTVTVLIDRATTYLETAEGIIARIKVPSDFSKAGIIKGASRGITEIKSSLKRGKQSMTATVERFKTAERLSEKEVTQLLSSLGTMGSYMDPKESAKTTRQATASILNGFVGFSKGMGNAGEGAVDSMAIIGTDIVCAFKVSDPNRKEEIRKNTMSFVAKEHVNNVYAKFYNTSKGKWIEKYAAESFKTTGAAYKMSEGLGYLTGNVLMSRILPGSSSTSFAVATGLTAYGNYTGAYWTNAKKSSKSGQEWRTEEVWKKGKQYGAANAIWETTQAYVGAEVVPKFRISSVSQTKNMLARVSADTMFNAADTPYRATIDTVLNGKGLNKTNWKESFERQGGWKSVGIDVGIGAIGSLTGEVINRNATIKYDDGIGNKKGIKVKDLERFMEEELTPNGSLKRVDYSSTDNYFYRNQTTPNEMTNAVLEYLDRNYITKENAGRAVLFVQKYHSSLDPTSVNLDNWIHSDLPTKYVDIYGDNICENMIIPFTREQKIKIIGERTINTNFYTDKEYSIMQRYGQFSQNTAGLNFRGRISVIKTPSENDGFIKYIAETSNLSADEIVETYGKDTVFHENLHQITETGSRTGLTDGNDRIGINEATTQLLTDTPLDSTYEKTRYLYNKLLNW